MRTGPGRIDTNCLESLVQLTHSISNTVHQITTTILLLSSSFVTVLWQESPASRYSHNIFIHTILGTTANYISWPHFFFFFSLHACAFCHHLASVWIQYAIISQLYSHTHHYGTVSPMAFKIYRSEASLQRNTVLVQ